MRSTQSLSEFSASSCSKFCLRGLLCSNNLDLAPLFYRIRHRLHHLHVFKSLFEAWLGTDSAWRSHRGDEISFDVPALLELRRYRKLSRCFIANLSSGNPIRCEIVFQHSLASLELQSVSDCKRGDS